ncbi:MAG: hypothetical protein QW282_00255 [Nitrososphaerales archaeon]
MTSHAQSHLRDKSQQRDPRDKVNSAKEKLLKAEDSPRLGHVLHPPKV